MKNAESLPEDLRGKLWAARPLTQPMTNIKQEVISSFELASTLLASKNHGALSMIAIRFK